MSNQAIEKELDQSPLKSKKWSASILFMFMCKALEFYMIHKGVSEAVLQQTLFWEGMVMSVLVGGQALVDSVVRGIFHYKGNGKKESVPPHGPETP